MWSTCAKTPSFQLIAPFVFQVYYVALIAEQGLRSVIQHCCAPILSISMRSGVDFSCSARWNGHAVCQCLCSWSHGDMAEDLARMLAAAQAFCDEAKAVWLGARQLSQQTEADGSNISGGSNVMDSDSLLPQLMPPWLQDHHGSMQQLGGLCRNVWLWRGIASACTANTSSVPSSSSNMTPEISPSTTPDTMVFKFLEADNGREDIARRNWAVHKAWGLAGCAPLVVSCLQS